MKKRERLLVVCGALVIAGSHLGARQSVAGDWVGGYQDGRSFVYVTPSFVTEGGAPSGTTSIPLQRRRNVPLADLRLDGRHLSFTLAERGGFRPIELEVGEGVLSGTVDLGGRSLPFHLVRLVPTSERIRHQSGLYQLADGTVVGVSAGGEMGFPEFIDFRTGMDRALFPLSDTEYAIGPGMYVPYPRERLVSFREAGGAIEISVREGTRELRGRRLDSFREENVRFRNADVELAGVLMLPRGPGPFPALVFIHGSGPATRGGPFLLPQYFAHLGIATLSYDKRGCGESTGTYNRQVDAEEFELLAWDALAGVDLLKTRADIAPKRIGLWGISQAGWIIAIAAASSSDVAFSLVVSGPACSLGEEGQFSMLTGDDGSGPRLSNAEIAARLRASGPSGFDPRFHLGEIASPSLWIYGGHDESVPVDVSIEALEKIKKERGRDITIHLFPAGNHIQLECEVGDRAEFPLVRGFVPGYFELMVEWLRQQTGLVEAAPAPR